MDKLVHIYMKYLEIMDIKYMGLSELFAKNYQM